MGDCKQLLAPDDSDFFSTLARIRDDDSASDVSSDVSWSDWDETEPSAADTDVKLEPEESSFMKDGNICSDDNSGILATKDHPMIKRERHPGSKHPGRQNKYKAYPCKLCNDVFASKSGFLRHRKTHGDSGKNNITCDICKKSFPTESCFKTHIVESHSAYVNSSWKCNTCGKIFVNEHSLTLHKNIHAGVRFPCDLCDKTFSANSSLKCHMKLHEDSTKLSLRCKFCEKGFANSYNLKMHEKTHTGQQDFVCDTCDVKFSRMADLERHVTIHTGEKPYKCDICSARFRVPGDLGRHRRKHEEATERKKQSCRYCNKVYARPNELKQHETKHEEEMGLPITHAQFTCGICRKILSNQFTYEAHLLFHKRQNESGGNREANNSKCTSKKLDCEFCGNTFSNTSNKLKHMRRKHSDSIFKCDSCGKIFPDLEGLKWHIKFVHLRQYPFPCSQCDRQFEKRKQLQRHEVRVHTVGHAKF